MGTSSSKCHLCSENLTEDLARPDSCSRHYFHRQCLAKYATRNNNCPIDNKQFLEIIYESGSRVIIQRHNSEDVNDNAELQQMAAVLALQRQLAYITFSCTICGNSDTEDREKAKPTSCEHEFHKDCLLRVLLTDNHCPKCMRLVEKVACENGELLSVNMNPLRQFLAIASASEDFKCNICDDDDKTQERAFIPNCKHEFHRECLVDYIRRIPDESPCPTCGIQVTEIHCLYGAVLKITEKKDKENDGEEEEDGEEKKRGEENEQEEEKEEENREETEAKDKKEEVESEKNGNVSNSIHESESPVILEEAESHDS